MTFCIAKLILNMLASFGIALAMGEMKWVMIVWMLSAFALIAIVCTRFFCLLAYLSQCILPTPTLLHTGIASVFAAWAKITHKPNGMMVKSITVLCACCFGVAQILPCQKVHDHICYTCKEIFFSSLVRLFLQFPFGCHIWIGILFDINRDSIILILLFTRIYEMALTTTRRQMVE